MYRNRTPLWRFGVAILALGALGLGACGGDDEPDSVFQLDWFLTSPPYPGERNEVDTSCGEAGGGVVRLEVFDPVNRRLVYKRDFACDSNAAQSDPIAPGNYLVNVSLVRLGQRGETVISAWNGAGVPWTIHRRGPTYFGRPIQFSVQTITITWSLARGSTPILCGDVGATTVRLITQTGTAPPVNFDFKCDDRGGETIGVPIGVYGIGVQLLDATGKVLDEEPVMTENLPESPRFRKAYTFQVP